MYEDTSNSGEYADYFIDLERERQNEVIWKLEEEELINGYMGVTDIENWKLNVPNAKLTDEVKKLISLGEYKHNIQSDGSLDIDISPIAIYGEAYTEILKIAGINDLKDNEIILVNSRSIPNSKAGDEVPITKYEAGDIISVNANNLGETKELKVVSIVDNIEPYLTNDRNISAIISDELVKEYFERAGISQNVKLFLSTNKPYEIDKIAKNLSIYTTNKYADRLSEASKKAILEIAVYTFIIFITLMTIMNIGNIISSSIILRKKEISMVKSIGMSEKQIRKMLFLEGLFLGIHTLILGIFMSVIILYCIYLKMVNIKLYKFTVSYTNIITSTIVMYLVIFISIMTTGRKLNNRNIIEDIRNENVD